MDAFFTSSGLLALITLTLLEIVLGVDNSSSPSDTSPIACQFDSVCSCDEVNQSHGP